MRLPVFVLSALLLCCACQPAQAQTSSQSSQSSQSIQAVQSVQSVPMLRTSTRIVAVPLVATRPDGSLVEDVRPSEMRVFDNDKLQTIASFEAMENSPAMSQGNAGTSQRAQLPVAVDYPHSSILLLDALNTAWSNQVYVRRAIEHLLDGFPAGQRIAIYALSDHLYRLHDFSSNGTELRAALSRFSSGQTVNAVASTPSNPSSAESPTYTDRPSTPDAAAVGNLPSRGADETTLYYQRARMMQTLQAMTAIAGAVKNVPGQKDLFWVSAAFPLTVHRADLKGDDLYYDETEQAMRALSSADLRLYPIDARGLTMSLHANINIDTMRLMAVETGGRAFYNNNDLLSEMRQALEDSREGYLLTYAPNDFREDGSFHKINLQVSRAGVALRYRPGYFAESSPPVIEQTASTAKPQHNAQNNLASTFHGAEQGDPTAQFDMGVRYDQGLGVAQDYAQAAAWYRKAAEQGNANAQYNLGAMYAKGEGVPQDDTQAAAWWRKAAEQGNVHAQYNLGVLYAKGEGVPQDSAQAAVWLRKVADQGNAAVQYRLGQMYHEGRGVPQDDAQAAAWWRKAAEQGDAGAQYNLGIAYATGKGVSQDYAEAYFWIGLAAKGKIEGTTPEDAGKARDAAASNLTAEQLSQMQERTQTWLGDHPVKDSSH